MTFAPSEYDPIALFYDHLIPDPLGMVEFYVELARRITPAEVLEIGCGTGRQTFAMASAGACVHATDISTTMLAILRAKMERVGKVSGAITPVQGDLRSLDLCRSFPLVIATGGTLQHALSDAEWRMALSTLRRHAAPGAQIAFDIATRDPRLAEGHFRRDYRSFSAAFLTPRWTRIESWDEVEYDEGTGVTKTISYFVMFDECDEVTDHLRLSFRQTFPDCDTICSWMQEARFCDIVVRGGFRDEPPGTTGDLVFAAVAPEA